MGENACIREGRAWVGRTDCASTHGYVAAATVRSTGRARGKDKTLSVEKQNVDRTIVRRIPRQPMSALRGMQKTNPPTQHSRHNPQETPSTPDHILHENQELQHSSPSRNPPRTKKVHPGTPALAYSIYGVWQSSNLLTSCLPGNFQRQN